MKEPIPGLADVKLDQKLCLRLLGASRREAFGRKRTLENATAKINMLFDSTNAPEISDRLSFKRYDQGFHITHLIAI
ncbi:MAG: hypothetical protein F6K23_20975 [Okeania sp. SIO2C9]|uniref:hypothetical protein n=1 Tax=Okeania sp. SIO2C9 TaxID=2607791 RepID=UPI0013BFF6C9|nr:hypothetical protein [Okeania sp. SIO2C9]NEQ75300.1 hypothetical protein [Okeania sp. SIO2C9]